MKISVKRKLFIIISSLIVFFVAVSYFFNSQFLDDYYLYNKKKALKESFELINKSYKGDPQELEAQLDSMERMKGMHIIIQDTHFQTKYDSFGRRYSSVQARSSSRTTQSVYRSSQENLIKQNADKLQSNNTIFADMPNSRPYSDFINLISVLNNGDYILISTPLAAIQESASISNKFFLFTGLVTIGIGIVIIYFFSGRFTKPILQMNKVAQRMADLDFSKKLEVKNHDEIGELGKSINTLSQKLESSITELKDANERLMEDIERERKIDETRKEFISSISHELKTPIALIQGYAEGLKVNVNVDEENKNFYCEVIADEAVKMNRLVMQLLELSHIESGEVSLEKDDFQISSLIAQVLKKSELIFQERNIKVEYENNESIIVNADYDRIEQVVTNYLTNAINHVDDRKTIKVIIQSIGDNARVTVYNSGDHIPKESIGKIWLSFYKVDKARTRSYGGTGLGLSIVRAIQEAHGNNYGVNNVKGGVEFWFDIDLAKK